VLVKTRDRELITGCSGRRYCAADEPEVKISGISNRWQVFKDQKLL
jgi:hypothetical protein